MTISTIPYNSQCLSIDQPNLLGIKCLEGSCSLLETFFQVNQVIRENVDVQIIINIPERHRDEIGLWKLCKTFENLPLLKIHRTAFRPFALAQKYFGHEFRVEAE